MTGSEKRLLTIVLGGLLGLAVISQVCAPRPRNAAAPTEANSVAESNRKAEKAARDLAALEKKVQAEKAREENAKKERDAWAKTKAGRACAPYFKKGLNWSREECETIAEGKIRIGFTADQVRAAWGKPHDINRTVSSFGVHEQWVYGEYGSNYVYFEDGVCTTIQN